MANQHIVVQSEHLSWPASKWLADHCELVECSHDAPEFTEAISKASGLVVRTYTIIDTKLLNKAPNLRVVGRAGAGLDNIDLAVCRERNIEVVYTPDANTQAVVDESTAEISKCGKTGVTATVKRTRSTEELAILNAEAGIRGQIPVVPRPIGVELTIAGL